MASKQTTHQAIEAYHRVAKEDRPLYERWIGNISMASLLGDMKDAADGFLLNASFILKFEKPELNERRVQDYEQDPFDAIIDPYYAVQFYRYAIEGVPYFVSRPNKSWSEGWTDREGAELQYLDFGAQIDAFVAYNEFFGSPAESGAKPGRAFSLVVILNTLAARANLDLFRLTGKDGVLSIHDIALLAQMQETSVRNYAGPRSQDRLETEKDGRATRVRCSVAEPWLKRRRGYKETRLPQSEAAKVAMTEMIRDFFA